MAQSAILACTKRTRVGSRDARKLRTAGRIPASLQGDQDKPNVDISFDAVEFLTTRRNHVHLYDLDVEGEVESALVRELQWDALGDHIIHVEFKRVQRGVATESEVELEFYGVPKGGVVNHIVTHITISSLPSEIPDAIEVNVEGLEVGTHIKAGDLVLPEGVELAVDPDMEVVVIIGIRAAKEEPVVFGDEEPTEEAAAEEKKPEAEAGGEPDAKESE